MLHRMKVMRGCILILCCITMITGCMDAKKVSQEPVNIKDAESLYFMGLVMEPTKFRADETELWEKFEHEMNLNIIWEQIPQSSWTEKKELAIASRQLPDAFYGQMSLSHNEIERYAKDGILVQLDGLIEEYAPHLSQSLKENTILDKISRSIDGKIYALASLEDVGIDSHTVSIINKEWLDNLNLEVPETTEEFYRVLHAFKRNDPNGNNINDEIPFSFLYLDNPVNREVKREHYFIFQAFGVGDNPRHLSINQNSELMFTADKENWRDTIKYLHRLYSEGLIDEEVFTQDRKLLQNKVRNYKNIGVFTDFRFKYSSIDQEDWDKYTLMPPLIGPKGKQGWDKAIYGVKEGSFAMTSACQEKEAVMRWLDYTLRPDNAIQMQYGLIVDDPKFNDKGALVPSLNEPGKYITNHHMRPRSIDKKDWEPTAPSTQAYTIISKEVFEQYIYNKRSITEKRENCDFYRPYLSQHPYNYPYKLMTNEVAELSTFEAKLLDYIYKTEAKWIVEGNIDAEWETYLNELQKLGLEKYVSIYKEALRRSMQY